MKTEQLYELFRNSNGVTTDTRNIGPNQIFFALWGANFNGNKFAADALSKGASWAVIDDPVFETDRTILVDDCLLELQALATYHRKKLGIPVLAITGTNGKTTTKELISAVLSRKYKVHYTRGNLNNHIGVPLTLLSAPAETELLITEMGANHQGEIRALCNIALPDYGIITNIGTAHIEGFGSFEGVVKAKTELYEHLHKVNGIAIYNDKDPLLTEKIFKYVNRAVPYSDPTGSAMELTQETEGMNVVVNMTYHHKNRKIKTHLFGGYNFWNVKAAIATGLFFEVEMNSVAEAIEQYVPSNNRSQVKMTASNTLICDSYNANPSSMKNAIESFISINAERKMVILGDMLELGETAIEEHRKVISQLIAAEINDIVLTGKTFSSVADNKDIKTFADASSLAEYLKEKRFKGYTILIKGSRGVGLEKIYDLL